MASLPLMDAVKARLDANWSETPIIEDDTTGQGPPDGGPYLTVEYPVAREDQITIGAPGANLFRERGVIRTNAIERQYRDHAPVDYEYFTGQALDVLAVDLKQAAIATYTRTYLGKSASITPNRAAGATDIAAPAYGVLNTSSNVGRIGFNGAAITGPNFVLAASININNNLRAQKAVGAIGAVGIGNGEFTVTGQLQTYFGDASVYQQILNNTLTSFDARLGRADGNRETLLLDFPSVKLSSGSPAVAGKNQDITIQAGFQAIMHAALGYTMSVGRFWYLPTL